MVCRWHIILYYGIEKQSDMEGGTAVHISLQAILFFLTTFQSSLYHGVHWGASGGERSLWRPKKEKKKRKKRKANGLSVKSFKQNWSTGVKREKREKYQERTQTDRRITGAWGKSMRCVWKCHVWWWWRRRVNVDLSLLLSGSFSPPPPIVKKV